MSDLLMVDQLSLIIHVQIFQSTFKIPKVL